MSADLQPWQLQAAIKATLETAPLFAGDEGEGVPAIPVFADNGLNKDEIEAALSDDGPGACLQVSLPYDGPARDQTAGSVILDNSILVLLRVNPKRNAADGAAGLNPVEAICTVITALTRRTRHNGGEFLKLAGPGYTLERYDEGLIIYAADFTKEATL